MQGDYSRITFRRELGYSGVRLQQGRVSVDADANEQADISDYLRQAGSTDMVGPAGTPEPGGFAVTVAGDGTVHVGPGRYYVGGILCENPAELVLPDQPFLPSAPLPTEPGIYLGYLDVWKRLVTYLHDPLLRETALDGPDTAVREQVVWQIRFQRAANVGDNVACASFGPDWMPDEGTTGRLRAHAKTPPVDTQQCLVPPGAGYRRTENQLYRVEIHTPVPGVDPPTFVWSRENGSVLTRLVKIDADVLTIDPPGRDEALGWAPGNYAELSDDGRLLRGEPGVLVKLGPVQGTQLTVADWGPGGRRTMADFGPHPTVRRWDSPGAVSLVGGGFLALEDGVEVEFEPNPTGQFRYRTGDYWTIPARTATGSVEWPLDDTDKPRFVYPHGVSHAYAPLALLSWDGLAWTQLSDCRQVFPPLTGLLTLLNAGGDGQESLPGQPLPRELFVAAFRGRFPVPGVRVRFSAQGAGQVAGSFATLPGASATFDTVTTADGTAVCCWQLGPDPTHPVQTLDAQLLDDAGVPQPAAVHFAGSLSLASGVAYQADPACQNLADPATVQDAVDRLSRVASIYPAGGGAQFLVSGEVAAPLRAVVSSPCGPAAGVTVRFAVVEGGGTLDGDPGPVDVVTDTQGIAQVVWQPDPVTLNQVVNAILIDGFEAATPPIVAEFTAALGLAQSGSCCVTVGPGRDFATLADAVAALVRAGSKPHVTICLCPGEHLIDSGLNLVAPDAAAWHVEIAGSGRGTRVRLRNERMSVIGLASLALRHLDLISEGVDRPVLLANVGELTIDDCQLTKESVRTDLVTVQGVARVRLVGTTLMSLIVFWPILADIGPLGIDTILAASPDPAQRLALLAARLFDVPRDVSLLAVDRLFEAAMGSPGVSDVHRVAVQQALDALVGEINTSVGGGPTARVQVESVATTFLFQISFDIALALMDASADVTLDNCQVYGLLTFHAGTDVIVSPGQMSSVARQVSAGSLSLGTPSLGTFRAAGCRFTNICLDTAALSLVDDNRIWRNLFRSCQLTDNLFVADLPNQVVASHVAIGLNRFDYSPSLDAPVLTAVGNTVTVNGNSAPVRAATVLVGVPGGVGGGMMAEAANVMTILAV